MLRNCFDLSCTRGDCAAGPSLFCEACSNFFFLPLCFPFRKPRRSLIFFSIYHFGSGTRGRLSFSSRRCFRLGTWSSPLFSRETHHCPLPDSAESYHIRLPRVLCGLDMDTSSTRVNQPRTILGPLTTTFTPPTSCDYLNVAGTIQGWNEGSAWRGQRCANYENGMVSELDSDQFRRRYPSVRDGCNCYLGSSDIMSFRFRRWTQPSAGHQQQQVLHIHLCHSQDGDSILLASPVHMAMSVHAQLPPMVMPSGLYSS